MNILNNRGARLGLWLKGVAAASAAAGLVAFAPVAHAQSGTLSLSNSSCATFTGFTWNGSVLQINGCAPNGGGVVTPPACDSTHVGSFSIVGSSSAGAATGSVQVNGSSTVQIARVGGCGGAVSVAYAVGNFSGSSSTTPGGVVTFTDGDATTKSITLLAGSTPGTVGLWLTAASGGTASGGFALTVTSTPPVQTGLDWRTDAGTPQVACSTTAKYQKDWFTVNGQMYPYGTGEQPINPALKEGESIAVAFIASATNSALADVSISDGVTTPGTADAQIAVSQCPGDFSGPALCVKTTPYVGTTHVYMTKSTTTNTWACPVVYGNKYYMNVRQVLQSNTAQSSCPLSQYPNGCAIRTQIQNNF